MSTLTAPQQPTTTAPDKWVPSFSVWRHGGFYVTNVRYPSGASGCVSRSYTDGKWRIVAENTGPGDEGDRTFTSRVTAARAERARAAAMLADSNA